MTFGEKLQYLRKEQNWTQEQLADQIGISRQSLSKWELGAATPDTEHVVRLSRLFSVSTDTLLLDDAPFPPPSRPLPSRLPAPAAAGNSSEAAWLPPWQPPAC